VSGRSTVLFYSAAQRCQRSRSWSRSIRSRERIWIFIQPSLAVMEIFAFNTFDTGQPFSAASAYF